MLCVTVASVDTLVLRISVSMLLPPSSLHALAPRDKKMVYNFGQIRLEEPGRQMRGFRTPRTASANTKSFSSPPVNHFFKRDYPQLVITRATKPFRARCYTPTPFNQPAIIIQRQDLAEPPEDISQPLGPYPPQANQRLYNTELIECGSRCSSKGVVSLEIDD